MHVDDTKNRPGRFARDGGLLSCLCQRTRTIQAWSDDRRRYPTRVENQRNGGQRQFPAAQYTQRYESTRKPARIRCNHKLVFDLTSLAAVMVNRSSGKYSEYSPTRR